MKLKLLVLIAIILSITIVENNKRSNNHKTKKAKKDVKITTADVKVKKYDNPNLQYTYKPNLAQQIIKDAFVLFSENNNSSNLEIDKCMTELFAQARQYSSPKKRMWFKLTQQLVVNERIAEPKWFQKFAKIEDCGEKILLKGILSNEKINAKADGVKGLSDRLRGIVKKTLTESLGKIDSKMKKFITSAASTYRNDPLVNSKNMFSSLNRSKRRRRRM